MFSHFKYLSYLDKPRVLAYKIREIWQFCCGFENWILRQLLGQKICFLQLWVGYQLLPTIATQTAAAYSSDTNDVDKREGRVGIVNKQLLQLLFCSFSHLSSLSPITASPVAISGRSGRSVQTGFP